MIKLILFALITLHSLESAAQCTCSQICQLKQILRSNAPGAVPSEYLAPAILELSEKYDVDPMIVARVLVVESHGDFLARSGTADYGLMQINEKTAASMGLTKTCLADWTCNLEVGVLILASTKRVCRYNVGTGVLRGALLKQCEAYEARLASL